MPATKSNYQTIQKGYWVALTLKPESAPLPVYVGTVEDVDARGVRITLIDWFIETASDWDFFAPWDAITSALIATPKHDVRNFGKAAREWQEQMKRLRSDTPFDQSESLRQL